MLSRRRTLCAALSAVILGTASLLAGCTSPEASAAVGCTAPGVTDDQISLGVLVPDSGPAAEGFTNSLAGVEARLGAVNAAGGVNGRKVVYQWRDDKGSATGNDLGARELVERQQVFGLVELSVAASASAAYLAGQGVPVTGLANEPVWSTMPNMFAFTYVTGAAVDTQGRFVSSQGGTRAVILQPALSAGMTETGQKYEASMKAAGVRVVDIVNFTSGVDTPTAVAKRVVSAKADTIISLISPENLIGVLNLLRQAGRAPKVVLSTNGYGRELLQNFGAQAAGITMPLVYRPLELGGPATEAYLDAMTRYAPQVTHPENDASVLAYIATDIYLEGLRLAGACPNRQGFIGRLRAVNSYDAGGLISPISFRTDALRPTTCYSFVQANAAGNGFLVVEPDLCGSAISP
ncbi:branched-chain amino acid ABC transporter substrate-binding protein [Frankia sp. CcI49]|uniref:ABC transporter substrate-binding protein n=1 Tax=unclassified Frankia TaxID=2632575 RepID=UPI0006CA054D|nr:MULTISPECIES: ABC transporter substrate-binding protein [unclassified Frankia]KPM52383.1 branched-chain amino acid ABC transporter substrate-binding protein [Frankia sp. R43]ONH59914.1 branched-chain amino acid ABC transporter substrate-binding protein [Frankia sp. CcI49]